MPRLRPLPLVVTLAGAPGSLLPGRATRCVARHLLHTDPAPGWPHWFMRPSLLSWASIDFSPIVSFGPSASRRARAIAAAAQARLRPVCPDWPPEQFAALLSDVVRFHERWDTRDTLEA